MIHSASSSLGRSGKVPCAGIGQVNAPASRALGALIGMRCIHPRLNGVYVLLHLLIRRAILPWRFHKNRGRSNGACC